MVGAPLRILTEFGASGIDGDNSDGDRESKIDGNLVG